MFLRGLLLSASLSVVLWWPAKLAAQTKVLSIPPVAQMSPVWCWLATGEMVFKYYEVPQNHPNYQCGMARFQSSYQVKMAGPDAYNGPCWWNCAACAGISAGSIHGLIAMVSQYPSFMSVETGGSYHFAPPLVSWTAMSVPALKAEIDAGRPVIAGITPGGGMLPPGIAAHAVLIVGYAGGGSTVILNDPYPYPGMSAPYLSVGGTQVAPGQYAVPYSAMLGPMAWSNAVYNIRKQ